MTPLFVVLAGTFAEGAKMRGISSQRDALSQAARIAASEALHAEVLELVNPAKLGGPEAAADGPVVIFWGCMTKGVQAFGPFEDTVEAGGFVQLLGDDRDVHIRVLGIG